MREGGWGVDVLCWRLDSWWGGVGCFSPATEAAVAQLVERVICNLEVAGSSPAGGFFGGGSTSSVFLDQPCPLAGGQTSVVLLPWE